MTRSQHLTAATLALALAGAFLSVQSAASGAVWPNVAPAVQAVAPQAVSVPAGQSNTPSSLRG